MVTDSGHRACPGGCGRWVGHASFACRPCWSRLPADLRTEIKTAYRRRETDPGRYAVVAYAGREWFTRDPNEGLFPALTLLNPWAHAITHHGKIIENRGWTPPPQVNRLWIHAGKGWDPAGTLRYVMHRMGCEHERTELVTSAIVASAAVLGHCTAGMAYRPCECGPWAAPGQVHWLLGDVRALTAPVPCAGRQRLWYPDSDVRQALDRAVVVTAAATGPTS